jgi:hypothetical protein
MSTMNRESTYMSVTILSGEAVSESFDYSTYGGGMVRIPVSWTTANLGFKVAIDNDDTFYPLRDKTGSPVEIASILASGIRWYSLPVDLFGAKEVKLWSKSTGTESDANQSSDRVLYLMLKA